VILELELLLISIISNGSETATDNGYQQRHICSGSETATNGSFEPLQINFSIVVQVALTKLLAAVAVGNRSSLLPFSHKQIWLIKSDLLTIVLQHQLQEVLVDVGGLNYEGMCRIDVFLGFMESLLNLRLHEIM
jgi:hypothetical protein